MQPGDVLAGKYRVEKVLGHGAMGVVVAATHVDLGNLVALKMMLPDKEQTDEMRQRFLREARAAVRLKSQHVAKVLDVGTNEHNLPYIAMEFLEGHDLAEVLKKNGPLPIADAVEYVLQAAEAVGEAHAAGIVHRDLKPANMFLTRDVSGATCIKVLDFGISKVLGAELTLTQETQALGSPLYMSPEALGSAKNVDTRTDIWAFGIILYQLVAGRTPFHEATMGQLCTRILTGTPTPLVEYRQDVPPGFESVIHKCLQKDREKRFPDVAALAYALSSFAPTRARGYVERIARVMGVDLEKLRNADDASELQETLPIAASRKPLASVPGAGATSQAAMVVQTASDDVPSLVPAKSPSRLGIVIGAALAIIVPGSLLILYSLSSDSGGAEEKPGASAQVNAAEPPPVEPSVMVAPMAAPMASASTSSSAKVALPAATAKTSTKTSKTTKTTKAPDYDERQ